KTAVCRPLCFFSTSPQPAPPAPRGALRVLSPFAANGAAGPRRYVNLEQNLSGPQSTNFIEVSGSGSWHGSPPISSYLARFPVMGPFVQVFVYNRAPIKKKVSVWGYLVS